MAIPIGRIIRRIIISGALIGGVVGGVIGFFASGYQPSGAMYGYAIGSAIGGYVAPGSLPDITQVGPRLSDLRPQTSEYGRPIPIKYGTVGLAGNVIWQSDIVEVATTTTEETGGKSSTPSQSASQTTFAYYGNFAVAFCEAPGIISRMWAGPEKRLIYDAIAGGAELESGTVRLYDGSETQLPDSLMEAYEGVGNVPAYRGTVYAIFENMPLVKDGNRLPFITAEVMSTYTRETVLTQYDHSAFVGWYSFAYNPIRKEIVSAGYYDVTYGKGLMAITEGTGGYANAYLSKNINETLSTYNVVQYDPITRRLYTPTDGGGLLIFDAGQGVPVEHRTFAFGYTTVVGGPDDGDPAAAHEMATYIYKVNKFDGSVWDTGGNASTGSGLPGYLINLLGPSGESPPVTGSAYYMNRGPVNIEFEGTDYVWVQVNETSLVSFRRFNRASETFDQNIQITGALGIGNWVYDPDRHSLWYQALETTAPWTYSLNEFSLDTLTTVASYTIPFAQLYAESKSLVYDPKKKVIWNGNDQDGTVFGINTSDGTTYATFDLGSEFDYWDIWWMEMAGNNLWIGDTSGVFIKIAFDRIVAGNTTLASVLDDLCDRAGLEAAQYDTSALNSTLIDGYIVAKQCSVRAAIEPLQQSYFFDAVESEGVVKFVKRGANVMLDIPDDELAAHVAGENPGEPLEVVRRMENELPKSISVTYMLEATDYSPAVKLSPRLIGASGDRVGIELPMVLSDQKAQEVGEVNLYSAWLQRLGYSFSTWKKYAALEPSDVIRTKGHIMRITDITETPNGILKCSAVAEDPSCYNPYVVVTPTPPSGKTVAGEVFTNSVLMDIALLRDADDNAGFYWAAGGYDATWKGASLFKSSDGGANYELVASTTTAATIGSATTVLADFAGGNVFDSVSTVTVVLAGGATLSSTTELAVLNGANAAVLGNEIIQFKTATLNADGTYTLSGLLRGRRGTEWAMDAHALGDRFVLADAAAWRRIPMATAEIGLPRIYKAVSLGSTLQQAVAVTLTNTAVGLETYSPVHITGTRSGGDLTLAWVPRTRVAGEWRDYVNSPVGETTEAYEVDIFLDDTYATLLRTITGLTTPTVVYTGVQQTTDFGSPQPALVSVRIYKMSPTVGRGYPGEATV